jgi:hypothetical protein
VAFTEACQLCAYSLTRLGHQLLEQD